MLTVCCLYAGHEVRPRSCRYGLVLPDQLANVSIGCMSQQRASSFIMETNPVRLMSDYEVTLVNDNSESNFPRAALASCLTDRLQCKRIEMNEALPLIPRLTPRNRQEFYIKFKGPAES